MFRKIHSIPGLIAALLVTLMAVTGAALSLYPALERLQSTIPASGTVSVAALAAKVSATYPGVERIERKPSGSVVVTYFDPDAPGEVTVDPVTGASVGTDETSDFTRLLTNLHRKLLLDDTGRMAAGVGAGAMLLLTLTGLVMLANRLGGWRKLFSRIIGPSSQRLHALIARAAVLGLVLSAATGLVMSLSAFEIIPDGSPAEAEVAESAGGTRLPVGDLVVLKGVDLADLRELTFPYPDDPTDIYTLTTVSSQSTIDPVTGNTLTFAENTLYQTAYQWVYALHTGEGLWWLGLILGLSALSVPFLSATGFLIWKARQGGRVKIAGNVGAQAAGIVVLVGSETNSTYGFAATLHKALTEAGHKVHVGAMNDVAVYRRAERLIILTATYGDGEAPSSAKRFLNRLSALPALPAPEFAVLGFGDRQFARYCAYADDVDAVLANKGCRRMIETGRIDRQSSQAFAQWGEALGAALGAPLILDHIPTPPRTSKLKLVSRDLYGEAVGAKTAVLRFEAADAAPGLHSWLFGARLPRFEAGDLVGILPPGSAVPRFYSLASARDDRVLEICVRRQEGGLCSTYLTDLEIGGEIDAFIQLNPGFRPAAGTAPVILVGAGTGIGPLAGFIRHNTRHQPMYLWFGARNPASDFLYSDELAGWLEDRRLSGLHTAFSRVGSKAYVQDRLWQDGDAVRDLVAHGAQVMVCGGRDMAKSVSETLGRIVQPLGLSVSDLKNEGRYVEDVY